MGTELFGIVAALASAASWAIGAMLPKPYAERFPALTLTLPRGSWRSGPRGRSAALRLACRSVGSLLDPFGQWCAWHRHRRYAVFPRAAGLSAHSVVQLMLLGQVATIGMAMVFLGESLTSLEWIGVALVTVGVWVVLSDGRHLGASGPRPLAVLYGLASVLAMGASVTMAKGALDSVDPLAATLIRIAGGMVAVVLIVSVFSSTTERRFRFFWTDWRTAAKFSAIAAFITFGGFFSHCLHSSTRAWRLPIPCCRPSPCSYC